RRSTAMWASRSSRPTSRKSCASPRRTRPAGAEGRPAPRTKKPPRSGGNRGGAYVISAFVCLGRVILGRPEGAGRGGQGSGQAVINRRPHTRTRFRRQAGDQKVISG